MAVHFDCFESDREVESVVKTIVLNFFATLEPEKKHYHTLSADKGQELTYIDD